MDVLLDVDLCLVPPDTLIYPHGDLRSTARA